MGWIKTFFLFIWLGSRAALWADEPLSALEALKLLPKEVASRLARIEAREGTPQPLRWHFLVYDAVSESGLREFVVAAGEIVSVRELSQFAARLQVDEVLGGEPLKVDSSAVAKLARAYAQINQKQIATFNYALAKDGVQAAPVWTVRCFDANQQGVGQLQVTASLGTVISHEGFPMEPTRGSNGAVRVIEEPPLARDSSVAESRPRRNVPRRTVVAASPPETQPASSSKANGPPAPVAKTKAGAPRVKSAEKPSQLATGNKRPANEEKHPAEEASTAPRPEPAGPSAVGRLFRRVFASRP